MRKIKLLLKQHVGAPCAAIVKPGDKVEKGTLVATPTGLGANIFSSVYGTVEEVTDQAIVIQPDDEQPDKYIPIKKSDSKLEMVKEAGIVGMLPHRRKAGRRPSGRLHTRERGRVRARPQAQHNAA